MQRKIHKHPQQTQRPVWNYKLYDAYRGIKPAKHTNLGGGSLMSHPVKLVCLECQDGHKWAHHPETCPRCGAKLSLVASRVRLPRKWASDRVWRKFKERYCIYG